MKKIVSELLNSVLTYKYKANFTEPELAFLNNQEYYKKRMIVLWPFIAVGGAETVALEILSGKIFQKEFDIVTICIDEVDQSLGNLSKEFNDISFAYYGPKNFTDKNDNQKYTLLRKILEESKANILYIPNGSHFIFKYISKIRKNFPTLKIIFQAYDHQAGWINSYSNNFVRSVDYHIGTNTKIVEEYMRRGVDPRKAIYIPNGVNTNMFNVNNCSTEQVQQFKHELCIPENKLIVSFIARLHPQKRPKDFIKLANKFKENNSIHFLLVGDGELKEEVVDSINYLKLNNISIIGFFEPIQKVYTCTDILVLTSEYEGLPMVVLEALSMKIPVIATDVGGISDVIFDKRNGILLNKVGDVSLLAEALELMVSQLNEFIALASNSLPIRFTSDFMKNKYFEIFTDNLYES